jgi:DNA-directed RNA polymerase specialized sigma24 family protein
VAKVVMKRISEVLRKARPNDRAFPSDAELLERFRNSRDEEAFSLLVQRHGRTVLAACHQVLSDPADIDDAFQASFLVLVQKISCLSNGAIGSWLYAIAHRIAVRISWDIRRRAQQEGAAAKRQRIESPPPDPSWREAVAILSCSVI